MESAVGGPYLEMGRNFKTQLKREMRWNLIKKIITGIGFLIMLYFFTKMLMIPSNSTSIALANLGNPAELYFTITKLILILGIAIVGLTFYIF